MIFARIEDTTNGIEILVFPNLLKADPELWQEDKIIMMNCRLSDKDGENKLICNQAKELAISNVAAVVKELERLVADNGNDYSKFRKFSPKQKNVKQEFLISGNAFILLPPVVPPDLSDKLKVVLNRYPGKFKVMLVARNGGGFQKIMTNFLVGASPELKREIEELTGSNTFKCEEYQS